MKKIWTSTGFLEIKLAHFRLQALARIYVEFSESMLEDVVNDPGGEYGDLRTIDLLILLAEYHDYSVNPYLFHRIFSAS